MAVLSSAQVAVYPFNLATTADLTQVAHGMQVEKFRPVKATDVGWGSVDDDGDVVRQPPTRSFDVGDPLVLKGGAGSVVRLRARYYWLKPDATARRRLGPQADWRATTVLEAADVLLWGTGPGTYSGLVTDRPTHMKAISAFRDAVQAVDPRASVRLDHIPERFDPDFFLWLMSRSRTESARRLTPAIRLDGITTISSTDGRDRSVDVKDGVTFDRIELAAAVALGATEFGPAKFALRTDAQGADFYLELHPDGGFQPFKTSSYDDEARMANDFMLNMIEDLWTLTLPELRAAYDGDRGWKSGGKDQFRADARAEVASFLGF